MTLTPESLARHELVGLPVSVTAADNEDLVGIAGEVVIETTQTLGIEGEASASESRTESGDADGDRVYHVPKDGTAFTFTLPSGEDVTVEGRRLAARPARRTETTGEHTWR